MKIRFTYYYSFIFLLSFIVKAQAQDSISFTNLYVKQYELPRERFHIKTDKEQYQKSEAIYFSVFILNDQESKPFFESTNINCGLYNKNGEELYRGIFRAKNGIASGSFKFDGDLPIGDYYLHASTNWSQNFDEYGFTLKKIELIPTKQKVVDTNSGIDVKLTPEGGNYITNAENTLAFKISNTDGDSVAIQNASLYDDEDNLIISNIKSDANGIGKFSFYTRDASTYSLVVNLDDSLSVRTKLPKAKDEGLILQLNNFEKDKIVFNIKTNPSTLKTLLGNTYLWAIHKDGKIVVEDFEIREQNTIFQISKEELPRGLNTLTILDRDRKPILERLFFNDLDFIEQDKVSHLLQTTNDSIEIDLRLADYTASSANLAITIKTEPNSTKSGIRSGYLIESYLKNSTEIRSTLLKDSSAASRFGLDNFLILQGNGKTNLATLNDEREVLNRFLQGFTINGKVTGASRLDISEIFFYRDSIKNVQFTKVNPDYTFTFENQDLNKEDILYFGGLNKKGENIKPNVEIEILPRLNSQELVIPKDKNTTISTVTKKDYVSDFKKNATILETVEITAKIKEEYDGDLPSGFFTAKKVTDEDIKKYKTLEYYVRRLGFKTRNNFSNNTFTILPKIRIMMLPVIIINGFRSNNTIQNYSLRYVDEVSYEHTGLSGTNGGTLYINLGRFREIESINKKVQTVKIDAGFEAPSPTYTIDKSSYNPSDPNTLLYWNGNFKLDPNTIGQVKIPNLDLDSIWLQIDGFTNDGKFISQEIKIDIN